MKGSTLKAVALVAGVLLAAGGINALTLSANAAEEECTCPSCTVSGNGCSCVDDCAGTVSGDTVSGCDGCTCGKETDTPSTSPSTEPSTSPSTQPSTSPSTSPSTQPGTGSQGTGTPAPGNTGSNNNPSGGSSSAYVQDLVVDVNWGNVADEITAALQDDDDVNVDVLAGTKYTVPSSVLDVVAGRHKVLMLHTGRGIALSISGEDVVAGAELNVDMTLTSSIPEAACAEVAEGAVATRAFALKGEEALPFKVDVHVSLGADYAGKCAVLYRYDEETGTLKVAGVFAINEDGNAMFALRRTGEYVVVVTDEAPVVTLGYTVVSGDTLSKIARKNGVSLQDLIKANPQLSDVNKLKVGQVLNVNK